MALGGLRWLAVQAVVVIALASCGQPMTVALTPPSPPPVLPERRHASPAVALPEWYWEPVEAEARGVPRALELPIAEPALARVEGATRIWDELGAVGRERVRRDGVVVLGSDDGAALSMGAFYMGLREQRVPYLLTLDALSYVVHLALERALAEVDDTMLGPELAALLAKLEVRLAAEQKGAGVELGEALRLARGVIAVARALVVGDDPASGAPVAKELGQVAQELALIGAHAGPSRSPLLGTTLDYARFAVPSAAGRPGSFLAMTWLATAPLLLSAQSEVPGATVGVARSRLHARAAMLLARVARPEPAPAVHASWSRIARLLTFVWGAADDLAPPELAGLALSLGVALENPKSVADVVTVDRLRHRAARGRQPLVFDGAGAPGPAGIGMRLLGGHASADTVALASLVSPASGGAGAVGVGAVRPLPATLDLAVWLGAPEGRASLHEGGGDAWAGYDAALARAIGARPGDDAPSRHSSIHGSLLDVTMAWLAPREGSARALTSVAAQRMALESALAAWTFVRHAGQPFSHPRPSRAVRSQQELRVVGGPLPVLVEAAPEVIARLVATVGQIKRGLAAIGNLPATSPAMTSLAEVEDILRMAMRVASHQIDDEAPSDEDSAALASFPARLARLEEQGVGGTSEVPLVAELMVDAAGERVLSTATGAIEPAVTVVREPATGRLMLVVGAHVAHHELVERRADKSTDASHRARFGPRREGAGAGAGRGRPARGAYTSSFRLVR